MSLFEYYLDMMKMKYKNSEEDMLKRIICDYIAGMTDDFILREYNAMSE